MTDDEVCIYCGVRVVFDVHQKDTWTHVTGNGWCQDSRGYTMTPLHQATPTYHGPEDTL